MKQEHSSRTVTTSTFEDNPLANTLLWYKESHDFVPVYNRCAHVYGIVCIWSYKFMHSTYINVNVL